METINGTARVVRPPRCVGRHGLVWYELSLLLGNQRVELTLADPPGVEDGDDLLIAGEPRVGPNWLLVIAGSVLILIGIVTIPILVGVAAIPLGLRLIQRGRETPRGLFHGYAFYNRTRHEYGNGHTTLGYALGSLLSFVGTMTIPLLLGLVLIPLGAHMLASARRNARARDTVNPILPLATSALPAIR